MRTFSEYLNEDVNVKTTLTFIKKAHAGQKYGSQPYWTHPKQVADTGKKVFGSKFNSVAYIVALLHDVIEDTEYGEIELLKLGYTQEILDAVKYCTKDSSLNYNANIQRIISSGNKIAMMVKFADNYVNYTGDKSSWEPKRREKSQTKYMKSMQDLGAKLGVKQDQMPSTK
jgi:(p)ppGpp synthase/HD superfamily hydrolase